MSLFFSIQRASIHSSRILATEWTKASLRRMKKPELINLAKENHLDVSGTKNDIIIKLLTHQTAKVVGSTAPSISSIQRVAEQKKQHDSPNSDTQYKNIGSIIEQDSSQPSEPHPLSDAVSKTIKQQDDDKMNQDWVNAFDMKVAQRRSNRKLFSAPNQPSRPHPLDDAIKPKMKPKAVPEIVVNHSKEKNIKAPILTSSSETIDINELEGIDPRWVEAFELKVGSRDKKHKIKDTLSPPPPTPANEFDMVDPVTAPSDKHTHVNKDTSSKGKWTNVAIGTGMLIWYFGGEEGFSKIWKFFAS